MIHIELDTLIGRPIEEVFGKLSDLDGYNGWMPKTGLFVESSQTSRGEVREGTTFRDKIRHGVAVGEVVEYEKPRTLGFRQTVTLFGLPCLESRPRYSLTEEKSGTRVHHVAEGTCRGLFKLFEGAFAKIAEAERWRTLIGLKRSLE